jgi:transcriptional regulator of acetoin/glycerol metabolism
VAPSGASIARAAAWPCVLARACVRAAAPGERPDLLEGLLDDLREATGAPRAFLLEAGGGAPRGRILASSSVGDRGVSWTVAVRALLDRRPMFLPDLGGGVLTGDPASVRRLALKGAAAFPVARPHGPATAILLDSPVPFDMGADQWAVIGRAFAALASLLLAAPGAIGTGLDDRPCPVGTSAVWKRLEAQIDGFAGVPLPVLISGPSGSGKELVARALHERGPRRHRPFVAINCAGIPESLLERELFGAVRGAYTGADRDHPGLFCSAAEGTVFLDEIGDMPAALQAKLLRVLQDGAVRPVGGLDEFRVDTRVIAATHRDLARDVDQGRFRSDLRFRLAVLRIRVPALSERRDDLPLLASHLLDRLARRCGCGVPVLADDAVAALARHPWPGNVRELESVLARALVAGDGATIRASDLDFDFARGGRFAAPMDPEREKALILGALAQTGGNRTAAAGLIGWTRQKLFRRIRTLGI